MDEAGLLRLKREIEDCKQKASELKGQKDLLLKELQEVYDCATIEEGEEKIQELKEEVEKLEKSIQRELDKLEREYQQL